MFILVQKIRVNCTILVLHIMYSQQKINATSHAVSWTNWHTGMYQMPFFMKFCLVSRYIEKIKLKDTIALRMALGARLYINLLMR